MQCDNCTTLEPIEDQGYVYIRPGYAEVHQLFLDHGLSVQETSEGCTVAYEVLEEMLTLIKLLKDISPGIREELSFSVTGRETSLSRRKWLPLKQLEEQLKHLDVVNIIMEQQFTSFMQPIVDSRQNIVAYEFLLRPREDSAPFQPYQLFETARTTGLHSFLDRSARISAIETSALWLPRGIKRFVNFLPSSIYNPEYCLSHTFNTINRLSLDPSDFVFEVVETERVDNVNHLQSIFEVYRRNGIAVAMDDVGAGYSTLEQMVRLKPDYVKIDRSLIDRCDQNVEQQQQLAIIANTAREFGANVLAEGIERQEEFEFCRQIGIDLAQGYLFGKPAARPPMDYQNTLVV
ncbi:EAL domain-containing protein [Paenibacillus lemnae]|uniref:EAL domain-containing protein n=1 Tax=Paenibacillus lemnae TaxID=1330551 RepID=A0A848M7V5_PAELE|nr:EAL domain-containing protein [Paenibacillus lemnae]NMO96349.1 EAL domain-containing protein [Paenibacillus lemnae]